MSVIPNGFDPAVYATQRGAVYKFLRANGLSPYVVGLRERPQSIMQPGGSLYSTAQPGMDIYVRDFASKGLIDSYLHYYRSVGPFPTGQFRPDSINVIVPNAPINPQLFWLA